MLGAVLASATASVCCLGPFLLLATGISGAWMSRVMLVEPLQPYLLFFSFLLMTLAGWRLFTRRACELADGQDSWIALTPQALAYSLSLILVLVLASSEYWIVWLAG